GLDTASQPTCPGADLLKQNSLLVTSDKGSLVKWCAGVTNAHTPLVRVADNRRFAMATTYPAAWSTTRLDSDDVISRALAAVGSQGTINPEPNTKTIIILGGHSVQFTAPSVQAGLLETMPSGETYELDGILFGLETLEMVMGKIPGAPAVNATKSAK